MSEAYHVPVMLQECIQGLDIKSDGIYVDVTFGGGGHSKEILRVLGKGGRLVAFDQDEDALANTIEDKRFTLVNQNFRYLRNNCRLLGVGRVDGILADLGVSSHQFDEPDRGFSIRHNAQLDMRMDKEATLTAHQVINEYSEKDLHHIFGMYGEIQNAKTLARTIATARLNKPINTTEELKAIALSQAPRTKQVQYLAKVFQALRIEVNQELEALKEFLTQAGEMLESGGRLVVMSYHSLEDRLVKNYMMKGKFFGEVEKDFFGNTLSPLTMISKKGIEASLEEIAVNSRARSAKLRIAVKR